MVGNPPYIVVRDAALNAAYRARYASCHRQYSLGCPFTERFFELAITGERFGAAGFVGLITANSFMKREFGSKLIEDVLPRLDLTHVIDTSGAYIPGHGTPTVILMGCHRPPHDDMRSVANTVRAVMGIKGEPSKPDDPTRGLVWRAIVEQVDRPGSEGEFVSVADMPRATLSQHPWSLGGGGASDLLQQFAPLPRLHTRVAVHRSFGNVGGRNITRESREIGFVGMTHADEIMIAPEAAFRRSEVEATCIQPVIEGDQVRDWSAQSDEFVVFPYIDDALLNIAELRGLGRWLWPARHYLGGRATFGGGTYLSEGRPWWEWHQVATRRFGGLTISFAEIATHNHFILDRGGKVFKQTAPVIKLPAGSSEDDHLGLLGLLNSSVGCFWLKQVCHNKGGQGINEGLKAEAWERFYAFNSTKVAEFPLPASRPLATSRHLDQLTLALARHTPAALLAAAALPDRAALDAACATSASLRRQMIAAQEELDWQCYVLYGLLPDGTTAADVTCADPPELALGERAFETVLARSVAAGTETTTWFERHGSTPTTTVPAHWPAAYRAVVARRIALIEADRNLGLVERPEFKRRWNTPDWRTLEQAALRGWLLDRLEQPGFWPAAADTPPQLTTTSRLADLARADAAFMQVAMLYAGHADFDPARLVADLVAAEAVPLLPVLRHTDDGLRKRAQWQDTWVLQRREDAIDAQVLADDAPVWQADLAESARSGFGTDDSDAARAWIAEKLAAEIKRQQTERKANEVGAIPVPPKYKSSDFLKADVWRLRSGLDVPKERFVSFPGAERGADGSLVIAWAGWSPLQLATALAGWYIDAKEQQGWPGERLQPLLAGLLELLPWLQQWHNDPDPVHGERMGDTYAGFVDDELRALGLTLDDLRAWRPVAAAAKRGRRRAAS